MKLIWVEKTQRHAVFGFYKRFMPYARISHKEQIALLINDDRHTLPPESSINPEQIMAAVRLRPVGEYSLLIGMLVCPEQRGKGLGHQLMRGIADKLISKQTYLFALPHLVEFYRKHNFSNDTQAPNDIAQLYEKYTRQGKELVVMGYQGKGSESVT